MYRIFELQVVFRPFVQMLSLTAIGTPGQRSGQLSVIDLLLDDFRLCQRALRIYRYVAVVFLFSRLDLIEGSLYGFFYRNLFLFDFFDSSTAVMLRILICLLLFYGFGYLEASILDSRGICQNLLAAVAILHDILADNLLTGKI